MNHARSKIKVLLLVLILSAGLFLPWSGSIVHAQTEGTLVPYMKDGGCPPGSEAPVAGAACAITDLQKYIAWHNSTTPAELTQQGNVNGCGGFLSTITSGCLFSGIEKALGELMLTLGSLILGIVAFLFDKIIDHTIVHMAEGLNDPKGIGGGINVAWATLRDIANMAFIFILLWAAIQTILKLETASFTKTIRNIIIIALVINFSLFFSKLIIDAGNIATIGFYNSITSGTNGSLTTIFANLTNVQSYYGSSVVSALALGNQAFMTGLLGLVTMLVLSVVLLIAGVLFIARYIILVFIMVISPLAFVGYIIPAMSGKLKEWWTQLLNQSFFAPYFMLLIWVAIKIMTAQNFVTATELGGDAAQFGQIAVSPISVTGLILKFTLVIGFIIGALILSKKMATSTTGFAAVAGGVIAGAGAVGRRTIGVGARVVANSERLRNQASEGKTWASRTLAKSTLWTANKGQKASFDIRGMADTKLGKATGSKEMFSGMGSTGGKGGFAKSVDENAKAKAQYAKDVYGQTEKEKEEAKKLKDPYEAAKLAEEAKITEVRKTRIKIDKDIIDSTTATSAEKAAAEKRMAENKYRNDKKIFKDDEYSGRFREGIKKDYEKYAKAGERRQEAYAERIKTSKISPTMAGVSGVASGAALGAVIAGPLGAVAGAIAGLAGKLGANRQSNMAAYREIKKQAKEKSKAEKLADAVEEAGKEAAEKKDGGDAGSAAPAPAAPSTPPPPGP